MDRSECTRRNWFICYRLHILINSDMRIFAAFFELKIVRTPFANISQKRLEPLEYFHKMVTTTIRHSAVLLLLTAICCSSIRFAVAEDIIWYQGSSDYYTSHQYGWQGTTDGKAAPDLILASAINQPWLVAISKSKNIIYWTDNKGVIGAW
jgi:hypothetical protein